MKVLPHLGSFDIDDQPPPSAFGTFERGGAFWFQSYMEQFGPFPNLAEARAINSPQYSQSLYSPFNRARRAGHPIPRFSPFERFTVIFYSILATFLLFGLLSVLSTGALPWN